MSKPRIWINLTNKEEEAQLAEHLLSHGFTNPHTDTDGFVTARTTGRFSDKTIVALFKAWGDLIIRRVRKDNKCRQIYP